jgi:hypothetical protein
MKRDVGTVRIPELKMVNLPSGNHFLHRMAGLLILKLSSKCGEG